MPDVSVNVLDRIAWPLRTERLTLRPLSDDDVDRLLEIRSQPGVSEWITRELSTRADVVDWIEGRRDDAIAIELDRRVIGDVMLRLDDAWSQFEVRALASGRQAELGWVLDPAEGGRGYATEAVSAVISVCFEVLRVRRIIANCFADNIASWRLMERLGMRREGHSVGDSLHRSGRWLDGYSYALLDEEWSRPGD